MALNAADKKFLKAMIPHHQAAVKMAAAVLDGGEDGRVARLARAIREGQSEEIKQMRQWLLAAGVVPGRPMREM